MIHLANLHQDQNLEIAVAHHAKQPQETKIKKETTHKREISHRLETKAKKLLEKQISQETKLLCKSHQRR